MVIMKKWIRMFALCVAMVSALCFVACSNGSESEDNKNPSGGSLGGASTDGGNKPQIDSVPEYLIVDGTVVKGYYADKLPADGKIVIPNGVDIIDGEAFKNCDKITSVEIPNTVTSIRWSAFENCTNLVKANIPEGIESLDWGVFVGCTSLEEMTVSGSGDVIKTGGLFFECTKLKNVKLSKDITIIGDYTFIRCTSLENIEIPESVTTIGIQAFQECALKTVKIPNKVTSIKKGAFVSCNSLTSIAIPEGVTAIEDNVFFGCTSLVDIKIPVSVTKIGNWAFRLFHSMPTVIEYSGNKEQWNSIEKDAEAFKIMGEVSPKITVKCNNGEITL